LTGMLTIPKLITPLHIDRGIAGPPFSSSRIAGGK